MKNDKQLQNLNKLWVKRKMERAAAVLTDTPAVVGTPIEITSTVMAWSSYCEERTAGRDRDKRVRE